MKRRNSVSSIRALPTIKGISITGPASPRSVRFHSMRPRHSLPRCTSHCATIGMRSQISTGDRSRSSLRSCFDTLFQPVSWYTHTHKYQVDLSCRTKANFDIISDINVPWPLAGSSLIDACPFYKSRFTHRILAVHRPNIVA